MAPLLRRRLSNVLIVAGVHFWGPVRASITVCAEHGAFFQSTFITSHSASEIFGSSFIYMCNRTEDYVCKHKNLGSHIRPGERARRRILPDRLGRSNTAR